MKVDKPYSPLNNKIEAALCLAMAVLTGFAFGVAVITAALAPQV